MALDAKWNDDLDLARVIQTPKVGLGPFISQPEIPIESFNPMGYAVPGLGKYFTDENLIEDVYDDIPRLCQNRKKKDNDVFCPKLRNPLPLPHPVDISAIIHNRDHPSSNGAGGTLGFIELDGIPYEIVRRSLIELPTPFGFGNSPSLFSEDENDIEEEESTIRKSLTSRDKEEEASATSSYQASAEDTPLVLRSATNKRVDNMGGVNAKVMVSPLHQYNTNSSDTTYETSYSRLDHNGQQNINVLGIEDIMDIEKKKLSTIASESDVGLNTEDGISEAHGNPHNDESECHISLNGFGEGDNDAEIASINKSLEDLDKDITVDMNGSKSNLDAKLFPSQTISTNGVPEMKTNSDTTEQSVRRAMKERDKRDAELVSAAVFSTLRKNSADGSQNSVLNSVTYRSPRKQKLYLESSRNYYNHNLHFPPVANSNLGIDSEEGQDSDPALNGTPPTKHYADYYMKEMSTYGSSSRARASYNSKINPSMMGRRSTSTSGVDEPPNSNIPSMRHVYQRSYSHTRPNNLPSSSDMLLTSSYGALNKDIKSNSQSKDIVNSKDSISKNPDSYSTVV